MTIAITKSVISFITTTQTYLPADRDPVTVAAGSVVRVLVQPSADVACVTFYDFTGRSPVILKADADSPFDLTFTAPANAETRWIGVEPKDKDGGKVGKTLAYPVNGRTLVVNPPKPTTDGDPLPNVPRDTTEPAAVCELGFAGNSGDGVAQTQAMIDQAAAAGMKWVRLWTSTFGRLDDGTIAIIKYARAKGMQVMLCVCPGNGPFGSPDFARFAQFNADVLPLVAIVEAGNEYNLAEYRPWDFGSEYTWHVPYVTRFLQPLYQAVKPFGCRVACCCTTDQPRDAGDYIKHATLLIAAGARDCCDVVALHIYFPASAINQVAGVIQALAALWGKPVIITEGAPHQNASQLADYPSYLSACRDGGAIIVAIYRGGPHKDARRWPAARSLFDALRAPTALFGIVMKWFASK